MNTTERKAAIRDMINNMIKGENDAAEANFHDVLSAKTRERLNMSVQSDLTLDDQDEQTDTGD